MRARYSSPYELAAAVTHGREQQAPHLAKLDDVWVRIDRGERVKVVISMPPGHGKSQRTRWGMAWFMSRNPERRNGYVAYGADFSARHSRWVRDIIADHPDVFACRVAGLGAADAWSLERLDPGTANLGGLVSVGIGGGLTGMPIDGVLVIDDPVKNQSEAYSAATKARNWDWWLTVGQTRLSERASVIEIQTRWAEDDLGGRFIESGDFEVINFPAICESDDDVLGRQIGEPLWPPEAGGRYGLDYLTQIRDSPGMTTMWWQAMYQGAPAPMEGSLFRRSKAGRWRTILGRPGRWLVDDQGRVAPWRPTVRFMTVDLATSERSSADYTVASTFEVDATARLLLVNVTRRRTEDPGGLITAEHARWKPNVIYVESTGFQLSVVQALRRKGLPVRPHQPHGDKLGRAFGAVALWDGGQIYVPLQAEWLEAFLDEMAVFNAGAHDDQVDTVSMAAAILPTLAASGYRTLTPDVSHAPARI